MNKMGFLQAEKSTSVYKVKIPQPKYHSLTLGETGAGKTVSILHNILKQELLTSACFVVDEKHTLHYIVKHMLGEENFDNLYLFGDSVSMGRNDISLNLLELACGSKKSTKVFFDLLADVQTEQITTHSFWAQSASNMMRDMYGYLNSIKQFLVFMERHVTKTSNGYIKKVKIGDSETSVSVKIHLNAKPLTLHTFSQYFTDRKMFIALCTFSENIVQSILCVFPADIQFEIEDSLLQRMNILLNEMQDASKGMSQYIIDIYASEASGMSGVYFTACASLGNGLGDIVCLNDAKNSDDLVALLEEGNHIVLNSESLPRIATNTIVSRVLDILMLRAKRKTPKPIAFIADEVSRVLSRHSELDHVLAFGRDAKVRVHVSTQSESQIEELFGELKYKTMLENFGDIFRLSSDKYFLPKFHYYDKKKKTVYRAEPILVEEKVLMCIEKKYQEYMSQFENVEKKLNEVVVFDARLYGEKSKLILVDLNTLEERECEFFHSRRKVARYFKSSKLVRSR